MKIKLYNNFKNWDKKGAIFVYSDPHFNDPDCQIINPAWPKVEEQIKNINSVVGKNDILIILGDVGDKSFVKQLKGYKVLVTGNHDKGVSNYIKKYLVVDENNELFCVCRSFEEAKEYMDEYDLDKNKQLYIKTNRMFDEVYDGPIFISNRILLSHEPIDIPFGINIHGHVHGGEKLFYCTDTRLQYNVCSDVVGWKPVRLDSITNKFAVTTIHRTVIEKRKKEIGQ